MAGKKNINLMVDPDLWYQARLEALKQHKTLVQFLDEAIREKIKQAEYIALKADGRGEK